MREVATGEAQPIVFQQVGTPAYQAGVDDAFEQARLRGYATGHAAGVRAAIADANAAASRAQAERDGVRAAFAQQAGAAMVALTAATARANEVAAESGRADREEVVRLAVELTETILGVELASGDRSARSVIARVLAARGARDAHQVRVNVQDLRALEEAGVLPESPALVADTDLSPGDAVVELHDGRIDMRIQSALDRVRELTDPDASTDSSF